MNRKNTFALVAAVLVSSSLAGCSRSTPVQAAPEPVRGLSIGHVKSEQIAETISITGTVQPKESSVLSAQTSGRILSVSVREGDHVRAGQILVTLESAEAQAELTRAQASAAASQHQVAAAQTQADLANSTLARYQFLRDRKSVSPQEYDEVERRAQTASENLAAAKAQQQAAMAGFQASRVNAGYSQIRAPFAGVVADRRVDPGTLATPGLPLLQVNRAGNFQALAAIAEAFIPNIKIGMPLAIKLSDSSSGQIAGKVAEIDPAADPASRTFLLKIDLPPSPILRAGMAATALVPQKQRKALTIPVDAVVNHESIHVVWVVDASGLAGLRYVTLGASSGGRVEVLSGLSEGEAVVLNPSDRELGGRKIEVAQ